MRWPKRLKILRISKVVIPIALAVSLLFAGFAVFAREAENFVVRVQGEPDVKLALSFYEDRRDQTTRLLAPIDGRYDDATYVKNKQLLYNDIVYDNDLPDDIAQSDYLHSVHKRKNVLAFYSFSFYLINNSDRAVDVDMTLKIDEMVVADKNGEHHLDEAVRVMFIEGRPLLSDNTYTVYKKAEKTEEEEKALAARVDYGNTINFVSDRIVFDRKGDMGIRNMPKDSTRRFTIVIWLEGWDESCINEIRYDSLKMSLDFQGY